jgi:2-polyprenyl-3-methyl-5-hydroxy-6-metoxy-1,4-benzoquinol methylase
MKTQQYFKNLRSEMCEFLPVRYERVLEIGCGEGLFRANLTLPNTYVGVEPEAKPAAVARNVLDQVLVGTFDEVADQLPRQHFDLVICNDVIEHMPDHDRFLEKIKEYISQDGVLVGSIPNMRYLPVMRELLVDRDWRYRESGVLDSTHLRFFTERSWGRTLAMHGYAVEQLQGITPIPIEGNLREKSVRRLMIAVLGNDIRFQQFGFRSRISR